MYQKTKEERRLWWQNLSAEEREIWIAKWQKRKERRRKNRPPKPVKVNRKLPWMNEGVYVDDTNRDLWRRTIERKNPWLLGLEKK